MAKIITTLVFSPGKNGSESSFAIVPVGNISVHFQTLILPLIVIIQQDNESDNIQSLWNDMNKHNKLRQTKSRQHLQDASRDLPAKLLKILGTCVKIL